MTHSKKAGLLGKVFCGDNVFKQICDHFSILYGSQFNIELGGKEVTFILSSAMPEDTLATEDPEISEALNIYAATRQVLKLLDSEEDAPDHYQRFVSQVSREFNVDTEVLEKELNKYI